MLRSFASARHHGEPPNRAAVVRLAIELTTPRERAELCSYVQAAVLYTLIQEISSGGSEVRVELARWVDEQVTDERLASLLSGVAVLRHAGLPHVRWEISYEFSHDSADYLWLLADPGHSRGIVRADSPAAQLSSTPRQRLTERLLGINSTGSAPVQLPSPLPAFNLANMCPQPGAAVAEPTIHLGTGIVDQQFQVFRPRDGADRSSCRRRPEHLPARLRTKPGPSRRREVHL